MPDLHLPPPWVTETLGWPTGRGVRVGIVNSGFDRALRDERVLSGVSFVDPADDLRLLRTDDDQDRIGAGTACADMVLRIAPEARVVPIRIFGDGLETSPSVLCEALLWAAGQRLDVLSVGAGSILEHTLHPLYAACLKVVEAGTVIVAAGHPDGLASYPAVFVSAIGVESQAFPSPYDYRWDADAGCECTASGEELEVRWLGGQVRRRSGTMYAAANVAGIVALLRERYPAASPDQVRWLLQKIADDLLE